MIGNSGGNPLKKRVQAIADAQNMSIMKPIKGVVHHYDNKHNYAIVEIDNPFGAGLSLLEFVPVQVVGGIHVPGPFPGDEVWVEFTNGKFELPKIVSLADRQYKDNFREKKLQHRRKGAFVTDLLSKQKVPTWHKKK